MRGAISGRGAGLRSYLEFIARCKEFIEENTLSDLMEEIIKTSGLHAYHAKEPGEKGKTRIENLEELVTATKNFEQSITENKTNKEIAEEYLDVISLDSGDRQASESDDAAQLMTLHSAKGLEFKLVLMTGLEEKFISSWAFYGEQFTVRRRKKAVLCRDYSSYAKIIYILCRV